MTDFVHTAITHLATVLDSNDLHYLDDFDRESIGKAYEALLTEQRLRHPMRPDDPACDALAENLTAPDFNAAAWAAKVIGGAA